MTPSWPLRACARSSSASGSTPATSPHGCRCRAHRCAGRGLWLRDAWRLQPSRWALSYASGNGEVVKLDKRPERIIAHAYSAAALMEFGIRPTAVYADGPVKSDVGLKGVDFEGVEIIGETWDKTATTRPTSTC